MENDRQVEIDAIDTDEGTADGEQDLPSIEEKYREQMRQIVTQKIDLPVSALLGMLKDQIKLNPEFQRRDRWTDAAQSRFIESLVMNVPVPPVFLGEDEYGHYVVLDGRQRLTAVKLFLENLLKLEGLKVWTELNQKTWAEMVQRKEDKYLTRRFIPAVVILKESSSVVKYDVFDRLNTGGVQANPMEIRNAIYRGSFTDTLHKLSRNTTFCSLWNIPTDELTAARDNKIYREMADLEIVLRFFALCDYESMDTKFVDYLGDFMKERNEKYKKQHNLAKEDTQRFGRATNSCRKIFGDDAFRRASGRRSIPLSDAVMVALSETDPDSITPEQAAAVRQAKINLLDDETFQKAISTGTNGRGAIATRVNMATEAFIAALEQD
jgi:Protein of unknown function DUF262